MLDMVDRRKFLHVASVAGITASAGCGSMASSFIERADEEMSDKNGSETPSETETEQDLSGTLDIPSPTVVNREQTAPRPISVDQTRNAGADEFHMTVENTGAAGQVNFRLWWIPEEITIDEEVPESRLKKMMEGYELESESQRYFDAGERRTVSTYAELPADTEHFYFEAFTGSYFGEIRNEGAEGVVTVELRQEANSQSGWEELVDSKDIRFQEGETRRVEFVQTERLSGDSWYIEFK